MSEARALLEAALFEANATGTVRAYADRIAATPSGADLIRRADRPEARVAVEGLTGVVADERDALMVELVTHEGIGWVTDTVAKGTAAMLHAVMAASLPAPRPPEPDVGGDGGTYFEQMSGLDRPQPTEESSNALSAAIRRRQQEDAVEERHASLGHPSEGSRIACGCWAAVSNG